MKGLLVFRERIREIYGRYGAYIRPLIKFSLALAVFLVLNQNVGYMEKLKNPVILTGLAALCAVLPYGILSLVAAAFALVHINIVSMETAILTGAFMIVIMLLYYGFQPGDSVLLLLTPMMFFLKVPYVIPLLAGLSCGITSVIPVSSGVCIYYILLYVKQNAGALTGDASIDITQKYSQIIKNVMANQTMLVMIAAFIIGILIVLVIRNSSMDYARQIAIIAGTIAQLAVIFAGDFMFNITVELIPMILGLVISTAIAGIYNFFMLAVDYSRTEYLQYEDDDYYYYVKAVPKVYVSAPDVRVQKINPGKAGHYGK